MIVADIFEEIIYPSLKEYVESNSIYSPTITKKMPQNSDVFPIVPVRLPSFKNVPNDLDYIDKQYPFSINIEIYAIDKDDISKRTICNEVTRWVENFFETKYHVTIRVELDAPNVDMNVHRNIVRILGTLDTKYGVNKPVIYPR